MTLAVGIEEIREAAGCLRGVVRRTPLVRGDGLRPWLGAAPWLKLENQQLTGSFKARGAFIKLSRLDAAARRRGVVAMSAGNHAQGVAMHAGAMGIPATIVMPAQTPFSKVARTRRHGAAIILHGRDLSEAAGRVQALIAETGAVLVHPYDDPAIIAGQATVGLEMLADQPDLDTLIVPIGGGGLIAGIAVAVRAVRPDIRLIGVQAAACPSMFRAVSGLPPMPAADTVAEGIAVKQPGELTRPIIAGMVDEIMLVSEPELESAVHALAEGQKLVAEGAGAAGIAAMLQAPDRFRGRTVGVVICGGNIDSRLLASILMRGLARDGRLARIRVEIHDEPGVLSTVTGLIGQSGGNIVEVDHQRLFLDVPVKLAELDAVVETRDGGHLQAILDRLEAAGYRARRVGSVAAEAET